MKHLVCLICVCGMFVSSRAQIPSLSITTDKTTSLIFPFSIRHVDRGTKDVLVQTVQEAANILLVKAAAKGFAETNLSVITEDGSIYSFAVRYVDSPGVWVYQLPVQSKEAVSTYANAILDNRQTMHGIRDHKWDMLAKLTGIYIKGDIIYCQLQLDNRSPIDYDIDFLRFYIQDKKKVRRTATQQNELTPLHITGNTSQVKANQNNTIVFALEKFTIPDGKYLGIEIYEKKGGRHLFMKVNNNKIIKAIPLPDLK